MKAAPTTNQQVKAIQAMAANGTTLLRAADALLWDFRRLQYWEKRLGIRFQRANSTRAALPEKDVSRLKNCAASHMTLNETAEHMGWGRDKVWYWEQKLGLKFHRVRRMKKNDATYSS